MKNYLSMNLMFTAILIVNFSCKNNEVLYEANDYTYVGEFTRGLEGPAVDLSLIHI